MRLPSKTHSDLKAFFVNLGCTVETPGFYNEPAFLEAEREIPDLLDLYADFVLSQSPAADLCVIENTANFIFERLQKNGRLGACVDASSLLSEFLNRQGIWNFVAKGGASLRVPGRSTPIRMAPIMPKGSPASTGHAWVVAPPFQVIDITLVLQPYDRDVRTWLPSRVVTAINPRRAVPRLEELVDPEIESDVIGAGGLQAVIGRERWNRALALGAWVVPIEDGIEARYAAIAVSAMERPLEEWSNISLGGLSPLGLWVQYCEQSS